MPSAGRTLRKTFDASPDVVRPARSQIADFAASVGAAPATVDAVRLAVSEAITNAVVHGYGGGPGEITVQASRADDELWIVICDAGGGLQPKADRPGLGLGLGLISQLSDDFSILSRGTGGTEVRIRFGLSPAPSGAAACARSGPDRRQTVGGSGTSGAGRFSASAAALVA